MTALAQAWGTIRLPPSLLQEVATLSHSLRQEQEAKSAVQRELDQVGG